MPYLLQSQEISFLDLIIFMSCTLVIFLKLTVPRLKLNVLHICYTFKNTLLWSFRLHILSIFLDLLRIVYTCIILTHAFFQETLGRNTEKLLNLIFWHLDFFSINDQCIIKLPKLKLRLIVRLLKRKMLECLTLFV